MLYHYTNCRAAREILASGVIKAYPVMVYDTPFGSLDGPGRQLDPAVWFTGAAEPAPTVVASMMVAGWASDRPGTIWRFAAADSVAADDLPTWAQPRGYAPHLFHLMLLTAHLAGENWEDWRLAAGDVPRPHWLAAQSLHGDRWVDELEVI